MILLSDLFNRPKFSMMMILPMIKHWGDLIVINLYNTKKKLN